jgi:hypothetical protein
VIPIPAGLLIKAGALAAILAIGFSGGCAVRGKWDEDAIAKKDAALSSASAALLSAKSAIEEINQEAEKRIASSIKQASEAKAAEKIAVEANAASAKRADQFADRLAKAGKSKSDCAALLAMDLEKVCGVKSR